MSRRRRLWVRVALNHRTHVKYATYGVPCEKYHIWRVHHIRNNANGDPNKIRYVPDMERHIRYTVDGALSIYGIPNMGPLMMYAFVP